MNVGCWHRGEAVLKLLRRRMSCENLGFFLAPVLLSGVSLKRDSSRGILAAVLFFFF